MQESRKRTLSGPLQNVRSTKIYSHSLTSQKIGENTVPEAVKSADSGPDGVQPAGRSLSASAPAQSTKRPVSACLCHLRWGGQNRTAPTVPLLGRTSGAPSPRPASGDATDAGESLLRCRDECGTWPAHLESRSLTDNFGIPPLRNAYLAQPARRLLWRTGTKQEILNSRATVPQAFQQLMVARLRILCSRVVVYLETKENALR